MKTLNYADWITFYLYGMYEFRNFASAYLRCMFKPIDTFEGKIDLEFKFVIFKIHNCVLIVFPSMNLNHSKHNRHHRHRMQRTSLDALMLMKPKLPGSATPYTCS